MERETSLKKNKENSMVYLRGKKELINLLLETNCIFLEGWGRRGGKKYSLGLYIDIPFDYASFCRKEKNASRMKLIFAEMDSWQ